MCNLMHLSDDINHLQGHVFDPSIALGTQRYIKYVVFEFLLNVLVHQPIPIQGILVNVPRAVPVGVLQAIAVNSHEKSLVIK